MDFFGFKPHVLPRLDFRLDFQTASLRFGLLLHHDGGGVAGQRRTGKDTHGFALPQRHGGGIAGLNAADDGKLAQAAVGAAHGVAVHRTVVEHRRGILRIQRLRENTVGGGGQRQTAAFQTAFATVEQLRQRGFKINHSGCSKSCGVL